jgi:DNA polymerase
MCKGVMTKNLNRELQEALHQARALLSDLQSAGLREASQPALPASASLLTAEGLDAVRLDLGDCRRCKLSENRSQIVFGVGNPDAELVFVGEGPGREEDEQGEPFVGEAGRLLDRILHAMGMARADVYICNVIKCRPPGNRDPQVDEIVSCEPFLRRQLAAIRPRVIVALGKFAAQTLLQQSAPISRLRGLWHNYQGVPLMPTYHPAYLLRTPEGKREVWEDMKQVLVRLRQDE